jgi:cell division protein ZapE
LAEAFQILTIAGGDFRHRLFSLERSGRRVAALGQDAVRIELAKLLAELRTVHPIRYRGVARQLVGVDIVDAGPIEVQNDALRFCSLIDVLYDFAIPVRVDGSELIDFFPASFLEGGFRQKYGRCLSRLYELSMFETRSFDWDRGDDSRAI